MEKLKGMRYGEYNKMLREKNMLHQHEDIVASVSKLVSVFKRAKLNHKRLSSFSATKGYQTKAYREINDLTFKAVEQAIYSFESSYTELLSVQTVQIDIDKKSAGYYPVPDPFSIGPTSGNPSVWPTEGKGIVIYQPDYRIRNEVDNSANSEPEGSLNSLLKHFFQKSEKFHNHVLALTEIVEKINSTTHELLDSEQNMKLPKPDMASDNFKRNNKLPAPDDEELRRTRLPISIAQELADTLDLTDREMAHILTISIRTYHRLKLNGFLNPVASERLLFLKDLAAFGLEVFEDQKNFNKWLRLPIPDLSNISPLNSLDTATGFNRVKTILERIEYGVYS